MLLRNAKHGDHAAPPARHRPTLCKIAPPPWLHCSGSPSDSPLQGQKHPLSFTRPSLIPTCCPCPSFLKPRFFLRHPPSPWPEAERADSLEVLDWVGRQPFCDGRVTLCGQSYDAVAAMWTLACGHPLVKCAVLISPFWDVYRRAREAVCPPMLCCCRPPSHHPPTSTGQPCVDRCPLNQPKHSTSTLTRTRAHPPAGTSPTREGCRSTTSSGSGAGCSAPLTGSSSGSCRGLT